MHFRRGQYFLGIHFQYSVFSPQGQYRLELAVPCLLGGSPAESPSTEQLPLGGVLGSAIGQLAGQGWARCHFAHHLLGAAQACLGPVNTQLCQQLRLVGVLVQPQAEGVLGDTGYKPRRFPGRQPLLGLTGKLGVLEL